MLRAPAALYTIPGTAVVLCTGRTRLQPQLLPWVLPDIKLKASTVVGRGEECPLRDPGSELRKGRNWRSRAKIIHGMGTKKSVAESRPFDPRGVTNRRHAYNNNNHFVVYPSKLSYYYSLRRRGGGSTGVVREPRHRPLFLVSYRTASTRGFPPPSQLVGALTHAVSDDRDLQW